MKTKFTPILFKGVNGVNLPKNLVFPCEFFIGFFLLVFDFNFYFDIKHLDNILKKINNAKFTNISNLSKISEVVSLKPSKQHTKEI